jgi:endonuclease YncB( thermonuclease family)
LGAAWAELKMARAQATLAAAPPDATAIARVCDAVPEMQSRLEAMRNGLWSDQLKRDAARLRGQDFAALEATLFEQERLIAEQVQRVAQQEQACAAIQIQPHQAGPEELEIAAAQLQRAEIRYVQAVATPTRLPTPTATPTRTPTATPWMPPSDEDTRIYALVAGDVYAVTITGVTGNEARVEIDIAIGYGLPGAAPVVPAPMLAPANAASQDGSNGEPAIVTHVRDGDTIEVRFSDGREEAIRLLDVNTPETVKPNAPVECYGPEASHHAKTRLCGDPTGKSCTGIEVQLEIAPERDRYNRLLGYVWIEGELFNEELASLGLAHFNDYGNPHQYTARIEAAATAAQTTGVGLWGMCPVR